MFSLPGYDAWKTTDPRDNERDVGDCDECEGECLKCVECGTVGCHERCLPPEPDPDDDRADDEWLDRNEP